MFEIAPPPNAAPHTVIPEIWMTTSGAFAIGSAARCNEVQHVTGLPYERAIIIGRALVADCVIDDSSHDEWNGHRFELRPRWMLWLNGALWGTYPTADDAERELCAYIRIHRQQTDQHRALMTADERERADRAANATEARLERERAYDAEQAR